MYPISCSKSAITSRFPRSSSLNSPARSTKQHHVHFVDDDNQEDFNSIYDQFDICGNCLRKSISCVDETYTIKPRLMKKPTTLNKKEKKSKEGRRKQDCIISLFFFLYTFKISSLREIHVLFV